MAGKGPPPKPTELLRLSGSWRAGVRDQEPRPPAAVDPAAPAWLDAQGKAKWRELARELSLHGLLTVVDLSALAMLCQLWSEWRTATALVRKEGQVLTRVTREGNATQEIHPAARLASDRAAHIQRLFAQMGMTPAGRVGLRGTPLPQSSKPNPDDKSSLFGQRAS